MTGPAVLAALCVGLAIAAGATTLVRPTPRLAARVRPYTIVTRASLGRSADLDSGAGGTDGLPRTVLWRLFGPPSVAFTRWLGGAFRGTADDALERRLRQAGVHSMTVDEWRVRRIATAVLFTAVGLALGAALTGQPALAILLAICGATIGATRAKSRVDRAIRDRAERIRIELYTVNQLLALHMRTGAGPVQATQRIVDRGHGAVVEELAAVLVWIRSGATEGDAFRRAADLTPEPTAARTYRLIATGTERGADLGAALLALSEDLRDARREDLRRTATKRRAAMLVPTIAILAPIMLLFIAAPLPSIIFGHR